MITLSDIIIYPLKSAGGIHLEEGRLDPRGLRCDRSWMVVDQRGNFVSQRTHAKMALVETALSHDTDSLTLRVSGHGEVTLPLAPSATDAGELQRQSVTVWHDTLPAISGFSEADTMLSDHLGDKVALVAFDRSQRRAVPAVDTRAPGEVAFADAYPLLLLSTASLDALCERLDEPIGMGRFRPNLVVEGCAPHAEDTWRQVRIGDLACDVVKSCTRCVTTCVDQRSAEQGKEPLRTLSRYRKWDGEVHFGQNLQHRSGGTLRVGQRVQIETRPPQ